MTNLIPESPVLPQFPQFVWVYEADGRYSLSPEDIDLLIDYRDNQIPLFLWETEQRELKLKAVLENI